MIQKSQQRALTKLINTGLNITWLKWAIWIYFTISMRILMKKDYTLTFTNYFMFTNYFVEACAFVVSSSSNFNLFCSVTPRIFSISLTAPCNRVKQLNIIMVERIIVYAMRYLFSDVPSVLTIEAVVFLFWERRWKYFFRIGETNSQIWRWGDLGASRQSFYCALMLSRVLKFMRYLNDIDL